MSQAPLTPPPTGKAELMDQAKDATVTAPAAAPAPVPTTAAAPPDVYQRALPTITDLVAASNYVEIIRTAELEDLNDQGDDRPTRLCITAPLVLSYLIRDELPPARFALTRLPSTITALPLSEALFALLASVWERNYAGVYSNAEKVLKASQAADNNLGVAVSPLVKAFLEAFRQRTLNLISRAYSSIQVSVAAPYFGLGADDTTRALNEAGWKQGTSTQVLVPPSLGGKAASRVFQGSSSLANFDFVTTAAARLEA